MHARWTLVRSLCTHPALPKPLGGPAQGDASASAQDVYCARHTPCTCVQICEATKKLQQLGAAPTSSNYPPCKAMYVYGAPKNKELETLHDVCALKVCEPAASGRCPGLWPLASVARELTPDIRSSFEDSGVGDT